MFDFSPEAIKSFLLAVPGILFALSIHEFSHGFMAYKLGDPTAQMSGRLTLNPLKHLDLFGFISMLIVHVGWAKPVPINSRYFKKPRRDMALTAIAGPLSNILTSFVGSLVLYAILVFSGQKIDFNEGMLGAFCLMLYNLVYVNIGLAVFNMLPIPPLDGSRILDAFLPAKALVAYHKYERAISIIMMLLLVAGIISPVITMGMDLIGGFIENISLQICWKIHSFISQLRG